MQYVSLVGQVLATLPFIARSIAAYILPPALISPQGFYSLGRASQSAQLVGSKPTD